MIKAFVFSLAKESGEMHASCTEANFFRESRIFCDFCKKERSILLCRDMTADHIKVVHCILSKLEDNSKNSLSLPHDIFPRQAAMHLLPAAGVYPMHGSRSDGRVHG